MNEFIAYCGLDCETCEARLATVNNNVSIETWSALTPDMAYCTGCRTPGVKTVYCDSLCPIRLCAREKNIEICGACEKMKSCVKIRTIFENHPDARERLESRQPNNLA